jgi:hypothetical protein
VRHESLVVVVFVVPLCGVGAIVGAVVFVSLCGVGAIVGAVVFALAVVTESTSATNTKSLSMAVSLMIAADTGGGGDLLYIMFYKKM